MWASAKRHPELSELGDGRWARARDKARRSIFDYASQMLRVQAERDMSPGFSFGPDTHWQEEFEDGFPFEETADQLQAIAETKQDMESERPMERLICGDVGFGKTEVAIRAVFKAVMSGKQAALMAPTTVLAQQHYQTASGAHERLSGHDRAPQPVSDGRRAKTGAHCGWLTAALTWSSERTGWCQRMSASGISVFSSSMKSNALA